MLCFCSGGRDIDSCFTFLKGLAAAACPLIRVFAQYFSNHTLEYFT